ncbi:tetratricopeptide repeat protein [Desulfosarcina ovata]|uniref:Uncharacterized protein n=1 Tax=Desulfosarcina ovata subsp. ovata TaxID=2752305 RepID=A0A5K8AJY8_9BACT|nr:tetratricopeptide repeat protein [Desulfosarcina ovata]BBO91974.1 hypothetical protein DSCOOX_51540 [Desulfosarcina ovata subsp. ovata]
MEKIRKKRLSEIIDAWSELKSAYGIEIARRYLSEFPNDGVAMVYLGMMYAEIHRYNESTSILKKAIRNLPNSGYEIAKAYSALGYLYQEKGNFRTAERWYRKALNEEPKNPFHHQHVGEILNIQGDFDSAEKYFRSVTDMPTSRLNDQAYLELGRVLKSKEMYSEALDCFKKALTYGADQECIDEEIFDVKEAIRIITS